MKIINKILFYFSIILLVSPAFFVFFWMLSLSLKNEVENMAYPPIFFPKEIIIDNFISVFKNSPFALYTWNSILVSVTSTFVALLVGIPAAYGIAKGKNVIIAFIILISRMTPGLSYLIPLFILFRWMQITGTHLPVIITHLVITIPIVVWIMMGFYEDMHPEIEEASLCDGANLWQSFYYISLPLSKPGIVVSAILSFIFSWNNFIFGVVLAGRETRTLPVAVYNVLTFEQVSWGPLAAAALIVTLPVLILTIFIQKQIVAGLTSGGVKGA